MPPAAEPIARVVWLKVDEQIERLSEMIRRLPPGHAQWRPNLPPESFPQPRCLGELLGHLLQCLAGFVAALYAIRPEQLAYALDLRNRPVNHVCGEGEALARIDEYRTVIQDGFALVTDADCVRLIPTVFVRDGEAALTLLLGNLEHLVNHKHELFYYAKLLGVPFKSADLYRFRDDSVSARRAGGSTVSASFAASDRHHENGHSTVTATAAATAAATAIATAESLDLVSGIRDVLVIASSSRSGSSLFVQLLRRSSRFLHTAGEINPFLRLTGLGWPASGTDSDELTAGHATQAVRRALAEQLGGDVGEPAGTRFEEANGDFVHQLHHRLSLQWPRERVGVECVRRCQAAAVTDMQAERSPNGRHADLQRFHAYFLGHVRREHPAINPYYYDLDPHLLRRVFPDLAIPAGPPGTDAIEEPPFILIEPWRRPVDWQRRILVIKTPSNSYRLGFLRALFPAARFRVVHLTRNPAASINGLRDGWKHWGFHSHYIGPELRIRGYSDVDHPDGKWWKFDLAPGWRERTDETLEQVCAFQWCAAHEAVLDFIQTSGVEHRRVRFEAIAEPGSRTRTIDELCDWCGIVPDRALRCAAAGALPWTMAVRAPSPRRWEENADVLRPVLADRRVRALAERLDYGDTAEWT